MNDIDKINIRRLDFGLILVLRELLHQPRTTDAAQRLGLSQPAISHALSRLRDLTGDPLFIRRPNGLQPTSFALALLPQVEALIDGGQTLLGARRHFDPHSSARRFRLAANDFISSVLAPPLRRTLAREAPSVRFTVQFVVGADATEALRRDAVDLALGRFPMSDEDCQSRLLADEDYALVARVGHPALDDPLDLDSFCALEHVMVSFRSGFRGTVDDSLDRIGRERRVVLSVPTFLTALAAVAESDMVATVPARLAAKYASRFGLVACRPPISIAPFEPRLLRHARNKSDAGLDWLSGLIVKVWPNVPTE